MCIIICCIISTCIGLNGIELFVVSSSDVSDSIVLVVESGSGCGLDTCFDSFSNRDITDSFPRSFFLRFICIFFFGLNFSTGLIFLNPFLSTFSSSLFEPISIGDFSGVDCTLITSSALSNLVSV